MAAKKTKLPAIVRRDQEAFDERVRLEALRREEIAAMERQTEWLRWSIGFAIERLPLGDLRVLAERLDVPPCPAADFRTRAEREAEAIEAELASVRAELEWVEQRADELRRRAQ